MSVLQVLENKKGWSWDPLEEEWERNFQNLLNYFEEFGDYTVPQSYVAPDNTNLGSWVGTQMQNYEKGKEEALYRHLGLDEDTVKKLEQHSLDMAKEEIKVKVKYVNKSDNEDLSYKFVDDSGFDLRANLSSVEDGGDPFNITSTGFSLFDSNDDVNGSGQNYIYIAIRRSDGYVQKPVEDATKIFAMDTGNNSSTIPAFDSGFPVDWALSRKPGTAINWKSTARITGPKELVTNLDSAEDTDGDMVFDSNAGWAKNRDSDYQSWQWKRGQSMDVLCYQGDGVNGRDIFHSMNDVPEMMIVKRRSATEDWTVYHTGLTSINYHLTLNSTGGEVDMTSTPEKVFKSAPTSTHFEIGSHARVNTNNQTYLALLFSSIDGISKVGSYTGNGNSSGPTVTLGFAPRLVIIKCTSNNTYWYLFDTQRGFSYSIALQENAAQDANTNYITGTATGFQPTTTFDHINGNNETYIYYAHA